MVLERKWTELAQNRIQWQAVLMNLQVRKTRLIYGSAEWLLVPEEDLFHRIYFWSSFNDAFGNTEYTDSNVRMKWKGSGRKRPWAKRDTTPPFAWRD
jgi:hypothetical protein